VQKYRLIDKLLQRFLKIKNGYLVIKIQAAIIFFI
jgi:hypothetical protein